MSKRLETENPIKPEKTEPVASPDRDQVQTGLEEFGGPKGREPTRFGDWEKNGQCIDF